MKWLNMNLIRKKLMGAQGVFTIIIFIIIINPDNQETITDA